MVGNPGFPYRNMECQQANFFFLCDTMLGTFFKRFAVSVTGAGVASAGMGYVAFRKRLHVISEEVRKAPDFGVDDSDLPAHLSRKTGDTVKSVTRPNGDFVVKAETWVPGLRYTVVLLKKDNAEGKTDFRREAIKVKVKSPPLFWGRVTATGRTMYISREEK